MPVTVKSRRGQTALERLPTEMIQRISTLACTDGGPTGCSLALVSRRVAATSASARLHSAFVTNAENIHKLYKLVTRSSPPITPVRHLHVDQLSLDWGERFQTRDSHEIDKFVSALELLIKAVSTTLETLAWSLETILDCSVLRKLFNTPMPSLHTLTLALDRCRLSNREELEATNQSNTMTMPRLKRALLHAPFTDDTSAIAGILFNNAPSLEQVTLLEMTVLSAVTMLPVMSDKTRESLYKERSWASMQLFIMATFNVEVAQKWPALLPIDGIPRCIMEAVGTSVFIGESPEQSRLACSDLGLTHRPWLRTAEDWKSEWMEEVELLTIQY